MFKQKDPSENLQAATLYFLHKLGAKVIPGTAKRLLNTHPSYPSVLSATEALSDLNIENMAVNLGVEQLPEVPLPSIAHLRKGHFIVLEEVQETQVRYFDPEVGVVTQPLQEFDAQWSGVLLMAELEENYQQKGYRLHKAKIPAIASLLIIGVVLGVLVGWQNYSSVATQWLPILGLKIVGTIVAVLLVLKDIGLSNNLIHQLCDSNANVSCGQVLDSPAATWFGWLKMSDLGLIYFIGGFLSVLFALFSGQLSSVLVWLGVLSALAVPYSFFSVYYQAAVVKKWCVLCLAVQALFWLELAFSFRLITQDLNAINLSGVALSIIAFSAIIIAWMLLKPLLKWEKMALDKETKLNYFLKNEQIMQSVLASAPAIDVQYQEQKTYLGNPQNPIEITIVNNVFCKPCASKHEEVIQLLEEFADLIKINVIFVGKQGDDGNPINEVSRQLIGISITSPEKMLEAMTFWFRNKDFKSLAKKFPVTEEQLNRAAQIHTTQIEWSKDAKISGTPTMLIENRVLPMGFDVSNLKSYWRSVAYAE